MKNVLAVIICVCAIIFSTHVLAETTGAGSGPGGKNAGSQIDGLKKQMMADQEVMALITTLQNDPEFQEVLADPVIMKAVSENDIQTLTNNPKFLKLLNKKTVKEIGEKTGN